MINPPDRFALTFSERQSGLWERLLKHMTQRLAELRTQNDAIKPEMQTAQLRGEIAALKRLIALDEPDPIIE